MLPMPPGYRFLRVVLLVGGTGFALLALFYLVSGQYVPGLFALFIAVVEFAALPLFRKLFDLSRQAAPPDAGDKT